LIRDQFRNATTLNIASHKYDVIESRDHVIDDVAKRHLPYMGSPLDEPLNILVSEIFSIKVADTQTDTSTDNKGRLKL